jgi:hypothetical protein
MRAVPGKRVLTNDSELFRLNPIRVVLYGLPADGWENPVALISVKYCVLINKFMSKSS